MRISYMKKMVGGTILAIILVVGLFLMGQMIVDVPADKYIVKQAFGSGDLDVFSEPGWKGQNFGTLTYYDRSRQLWFNKHIDKKNKDKINDYSLPIRFNDGGTARISGSLRYDLPIGDKLIELHKRYKNADSIEKELIIPVIQKSIQLTGPMMTSKESAAARRNDLLTIIEDQIVNGVYRTDIERIQVDDITSENGKKWVDVLKPIKDANSPNGIARAEISPIKSAGISISAIAITDIVYDEKVEEAIKKQYDLEMEVQTSKTAAITANQKVVTAEAEGRAKTKEAEWKAREEATRLTVEAERDKQIAETTAAKNLAVAELDKQTAEQQKQAAILRAQGEAQSMQLVAEARKKQMEANGALEEKLAAYKEVSKAYAEALRSIKLPQIVLSSGDGKAGTASSVDDLINMINTKMALDLKNLNINDHIK